MITAIIINGGIVYETKHTLVPKGYRRYIQKKPALIFILAIAMKSEL